MKQTSALELSAWLIQGDPASLASFERHASKLTRVYPLWYCLGDEGLAFRRWGISDEARKRVIEVAKSNQVDVWPSISNYDSERQIWDAGRLSRMLGDRHCAMSHLRQLMELAKRDAVQGLSLNFQGVTPPGQKSLKVFVAKAAEACHQAGLKLGMNIHARTCEPLHENVTHATDDAALNGTVDLAQIMMYDYAGSGLKVGAIASPAWIYKTLKRAVSLVRADCIEFGFPSYGYYWEHSVAEQLQWPTWEALVAMRGPARRDPDSAELVLNYEGHEAWYCDSVSILRKLLQARENGISRAAFWVLGAEDPRLWEMLGDFPVPFV